MLSTNQKVIELLNQNKYFSCDSMNKIGLEYVRFLTSSQYYDLFNPEMVNTEKNTLSLALNYLRNIDNYVGKPIEKYARDDIARFIDAFMRGEIKGKKTKVVFLKGEKNVKVVQTNTSLKQSNLKRHIHAFKRFWAVYRQYVIHVEKKPDKIGGMEWGSLVRAPKIKAHYEKYPHLSLNQIIDVSESLCKPEYTARMLLSVNLMGRKCEISALKVSDLEIDNKADVVYIKLPDIKKHSSNKVRVELYSYAKKRLKKYLLSNNLKNEDTLFPSKENAFAKELKVKSEKILGKGNIITPKTLRKLGVSVARELGKDRTDIEDIGGWKRNSSVLEHYFSRPGVINSNESKKKADIIEHNDVYAQMDKMASQNKALHEKLALLEKIVIESVSRKSKVSLPADTKELSEIYAAKKKSMRKKSID